MSDVPHWRHDLPGGYVVLLTCGSDRPPGYTGGLTCNGNESWVRLARPGWDSGWHTCSYKSPQKSKVWWELVAGEDDIYEAWMLTTGSNVFPTPQYDDIYFRGVEWLNKQ